MPKPLVNLDDLGFDDAEVCDYPDSNKTGVFASAPGAPRLCALHRAGSAVDCYDGESTEPPRR